jgi:hypothetical protein
VKVCVIGGSNSLMKNGYVPPLQKMLAQRLGQSVTIENVSIGGTFSHYGLWQLLSKKPHLDADIIVVEYALNDAELASRGMSDHWALAYEGLLHRLRAEIRPDTPIVCPLLFTRNASLNPKLSSISSGVAFINSRYGVATVDVNQGLSALAPDWYWSIETDWYRDASHYSKLVQVMIAGMVADTILSGAGRAEQQEVFPVGKAHFGTARSAVAEGKFDGLFPDSCPRVRFSNSLVDEKAIAIPGGTEIRFRLEGQLVALIVVSTREDGIVRYSFGNKEVLASARRKALDDSKFEFLMNVFVPDQYFRKVVSVAHTATEIRLGVMTGQETAAMDANKVMCRPTARFPDLDRQSYSFSIVDILYTGDIGPV